MAALKVPGGRWEKRSQVSAYYTLAFALALGRAIARACFRLTEASAVEWAKRQYLQCARADPAYLEGRRKAAERDFVMCLPGQCLGVATTGEEVCVFAAPPSGADQLKRMQDPGPLVGDGDLVAPAVVTTTSNGAHRGDGAAVASTVDAGPTGPQAGQGGPCGGRAGRSAHMGPPKSLCHQHQEGGLKPGPPEVDGSVAATRPFRPRSSPC